MPPSTAKYQLSLLLDFQNKANPKFNSLRTQIRGLNTDVRSLLTTWNRFNSRLQIAPNVSGLNQQRTMIREYRQELRGLVRDINNARKTTGGQALGSGAGGGVGTGGRGRGGGGTGTGTPGAGSSAAGAGAGARTSQHGRYRMLGRIGAGAEMFNTARELGGMAYESTDIFREYLSEARELMTAQQRFRSLNLGTSETAEGFKAIDEVVHNIKGARIDTTTQQLVDLHTAFGDLHHAIEFLPDVTRAGFIYTSLFGDTPEAAEQDLAATIRALEQLGALRSTGPKDAHGIATMTDKDKEHFREYLDVAVQLKAATGGRVNGQQIQSFAGTSGMAGMGLSPEGIRNMMYLMSEMGGGRVGTALMGEMQAFVAFRQGAGGQRSFENLQKLGLIDPKAKEKGLVEFTNEGKIKRLHPGAMPISALLEENPQFFADAIGEALREKGDKVLGHKVDMNDPGQIGTALSQIVGGRTPMNLLGKSIAQRNQILKDAAITKNLGTIRAQAGRIEVSDIGKLTDFEAKWHNLKIEMGQSLIPAGMSLLGTAEPFLRWAAEHPNMAIGIIATWQALKMLGEAGALVNQVRIGHALMDIAAGAGGAATNVSLLRTGLTGLATMGKISVVVALAGGALEAFNLLMQEIDAYEKTQKTRHEIADMGSKAEKRTRMRAQMWDPAARQEVAKGQTFQASANVDYLKQQGMFGGAETWVANALNEGMRAWGLTTGISQLVTSGSMLYRGKPAEWIPNQQPMFRGPERVGLMQRDMPSLKNPEVMTATRRMIGSQSQEGLAKFDEVARQAFPDSFKQSVSDAATQITNIATAATPVPDSLNKMTGAADRVGPSLSNLSTSLDIAAIKIGTTTFTPPQLGGPIIPGTAQPTQQPPAVVPSRAMGGHVFRDGFAYVHRAEDIVPARVSRRIQEGLLPQTSPEGMASAMQILKGGFMRLHSDRSLASRPAQMGGGNRSIHLNAPMGNVEVNGGADDEAIMAQVREAHRRHADRVRRTLRDVRRHDRTHDRVLEIGEERA